MNELLLATFKSSLASVTDPARGDCLRNSTQQDTQLTLQP